MERVKLFVPGRLCLLGEHSDWAGTHRMMNAEIVPGMAIVTGIEQGIYATAEKSDNFVIESALSCFNGERFECRMDTELLRETAAKGGFFSYVAGVASYVNEHYRVGGGAYRGDRYDAAYKKWTVQQCSYMCSCSSRI